MQVLGKYMIIRYLDPQGFVIHGILTIMGGWGSEGFLVRVGLKPKNKLTIALQGHRSALKIQRAGLVWCLGR